MAHEVRLSDPTAIADLLEALRDVRADAAPGRKPATLVVDVEDADAAVELHFFLRAWALEHPGVEFELAEVENGR